MVKPPARVPVDPSATRHGRTGREGVTKVIGHGRLYKGLGHRVSRGLVMNVADLIDEAKKAAGIESDSAFSKYLGLSRTAVGNWRSGVSLPDTVSCERLAGLTGQPLAKVIGLVGEARAHSREEKAVWRKLAASAAMLALFVAPSLMQQVHAATLHHLPSSDPSRTAAATTGDTHTRHYAKWWQVGHWVARLLRNRPSTVMEACVWA